MSKPTERFVAALIAGRLPLFLLALAIAAAAWPASQKVSFDRRIERMFAADDPLLPPYERLKKQFGGNEIVLAVYSDPELLAADGRGLKRLEAIGSRLKKAAGVKDVLTLAGVNQLLESLKQTERIGNLFGGGPKSDWNGPAILNPDDPLAKNYRALFEGYTHSADGQTVAAVCMLEPSATTPREQTLEELRAVVTSLPDDLPPGVLTGEPAMVVEGFRLLEADGERLGLWSTILLGGTILLCFRSLRWLLAPIAVVQWTLITTRAMLVWGGLQLSMVSSMLTALVTVVGVATVTHLIVGTRELRSSGRSAREAFYETCVLLFWPIVGAIVTDVAGFGSLGLAGVAPVRDFGTMMVIGSLLVLPATALLVPFIALFAAEREPVAATWAEGSLSSQLSKLVRFVGRNRGAMFLASLAVTAIAFVGNYRLEVETDFTRNFSRGSRITEGYEFVETRLGGAGTWDILLPAPDTFDDAFLQRVRDLETKLRAIRLPTGTGDEPGLTKVLSLVDALDGANASQTLAALPIETRLAGMSAAMPHFMGALQGQDEFGNRRLRIMLRAPERRPAEHKRELIDRVSAAARESFGGNLFTRELPAEVTGLYVLLTNLIESMLRDQWITFVAATLGVAAVLLIAFRSLKLTLIALVPNVLPIVVVMGLLGWLGLKINLGAVMISAVSMGLSVDSSIHYLAAFRRACRGGKSVAEALDEVQQQVGRAMVFSTIALVIGFLVLCISEFMPTVYFGALVGLAMLGGMAGNLIVLPLLLSWFVRDEKAT